MSKLQLNEKNLNEIRHAGIKQIFKIDDIFYAYVGYKKNNCILMSIFEYPDGNKLTDFPCLPSNSDEVDINGAGGAFLNYKNINLLTTGTPTTTNDKIDNLAQNDLSPYGKILEININDKNKFNYKIFSKGHRNPQGIIYAHDKIFSVEHGPRGGDELNIINYKGNYGWPIYSLGSHYNLNEISKEDWSNKSKFNKPLFSFMPSIGISSVEKCPDNYEQYYKPLKCIAIGSLRAQSVYLILMDNDLNNVINYEKIEFQSRIRKFKFHNNLLVAGTDYDGIIIGQINKLTK